MAGSFLLGGVRLCSPPSNCSRIPAPPASLYSPHSSENVYGTATVPFLCSPHPSSYGNHPPTSPEPAALAPTPAPPAAAPRHTQGPAWSRARPFVQPSEALDPHLLTVANAELGLLPNLLSLGMVLHKPETWTASLLCLSIQSVTKRLGHWWMPLQNPLEFVPVGSSGLLPRDGMGCRGAGHCDNRLNTLVCLQMIWFVHEMSCLLSSRAQDPSHLLAEQHIPSIWGISL